MRLVRLCLVCVMTSAFKRATRSTPLLDLASAGHDSWLARTKSVLTASAKARALLACTSNVCANACVAIVAGRLGQGGIRWQGGGGVKRLRCLRRVAAAAGRSGNERRKAGDCALVEGSTGKMAHLNTWDSGRARGGKRAKICRIFQVSGYMSRCERSLRIEAPDHISQQLLLESPRSSMDRA